MVYFPLISFILRVNKKLVVSVLFWADIVLDGVERSHNVYVFSWAEDIGQKQHEALDDGVEEGPQADHWTPSDSGLHSGHHVGHWLRHGVVIDTLSSLGDLSPAVDACHLIVKIIRLC
jgi:hypothetical protein